MVNDFDKIVVKLNDCIMVLNKKIGIIFFIFFALSISFASHAQNSGVAADVGYTFNKRSLGYVGASTSYHSAQAGDNDLYHLGGGIGVYGGGGFHGKFKFIPAAYLNAGVDFINAKAIVSQYFLNPTVELSVFNYAKLNLGYSFPFKSLDGIKMKGITVGLTISIGTKGYYLVMPD